MRAWSAAQIWPLYLSEDDIYTLYSMFAPYEDGHGLANAARYHFEAKLDELNPRQLIVLLAVAKAPSRFSPLQNPSQSALLQAEMWEKYQRSD
jgi:membrane peptidoglycan carboxypeptidase